MTELVNDARTVLAALDGVELDDVQAEAVGLLALVAGQDVEPGDEDGTWRIAPVTRPDRVVSVVDPESRHVHKTTSNYRDGSKAHIGVEPDTGLITACELTAGNVGDAQAAAGLLADENAPVEVLADSAYGSGEFRHHLREHSHWRRNSPLRAASSGSRRRRRLLAPSRMGTSPHDERSAFAVLDRLPARQREIVAALLRGERTSAIAASLFLSSSTIRSHLSSIYGAFGVHSQTELLGLLRSQNAAVARRSSARLSRIVADSAPLSR